MFDELVGVFSVVVRWREFVSNGLEGGLEIAFPFNKSSVAVKAEGFEGRQFSGVVSCESVHDGNFRTERNPTKVYERSGVDAVRGAVVLMMLSGSF